MTVGVGTMPRSGNRSIVVDAAGKPLIVGYRCNVCGAIVPEPTMACRACACRTPPEAFDAGTRGTLWTWSIVERSYPGIKVPFVSAIVDLDSGLSLKGTVRCDDHAGLRQGLPLQLVFDDAGGARDEAGVPYVGFHFEPAGDA